MQLQGAKNKSAKAIGQAAAIVQVGIDTARGAIAAYQAMAGIPFIGPALGIAAAAAITIFGEEKVSSIRGAQQGGIVPNGAGGSRDRIPALLEPGEFVVPRALTPNFIQEFGVPSGEQEGGGGGSMEVTVGFTDDAFEIIEQKLLERTAIGTGNI